MTLQDQLETARNFQRKLLESKNVETNLQEFLQVSQWFEAVIESLHRLKDQER